MTRFVPANLPPFSVSLHNVTDEGGGYLSAWQVRKDRKRPLMCWKRASLIKRAMQEAREVLERFGGTRDIWSHAFSYGGRVWLLSTRYLVATTKTVRENGRSRLVCHRPGRILVEVSPSPFGLTPRTLVYPRPNRSDI